MRPFARTSSFDDGGFVGSGEHGAGVLGEDGCEAVAVAGVVGDRDDGVDEDEDVDCHRVEGSRRRWED